MKDDHPDARQKGVSGANEPCTLLEMYFGSVSPCVAFAAWRFAETLGGVCTRGLTCAGSGTRRSRVLRVGRDALHLPALRSLCGSLGRCSSGGAERDGSLCPQEHPQPPDSSGLSESRDPLGPQGSQGSAQLPDPQGSPLPLGPSVGRSLSSRFSLELLKDSPSCSSSSDDSESRAPSCARSHCTRAALLPLVGSLASIRRSRSTSYVS